MRDGDISLESGGAGDVCALVCYARLVDVRGRRPNAEGLACRRILMTEIVFPFRSVKNLCPKPIHDPKEVT